MHKQLPCLRRWWEETEEVGVGWGYEWNEMYGRGFGEKSGERSGRKASIGEARRKK